MQERVAQLPELLGQLPRASKKDVDVVYIIQALDGGPVKIGHSTREGVTNRLRTLQTGNAQQLVIRALFSGGMWLEKALHEFFAESRLKGEWFSLTPELLAMCPEADVGR